MITVARLPEPEMTKGPRSGALRNETVKLELLVRDRLVRVQLRRLALRALLAVVQAHVRCIPEARAAAGVHANVAGTAILLRAARCSQCAVGVLHARADRCSLGLQLPVEDRGTEAVAERVVVVPAGLRLVAADAAEAGALARRVGSLLPDRGTCPARHERSECARQA